MLFQVPTQRKNVRRTTTGEKKGRGWAISTPNAKGERETLKRKEAASGGWGGRRAKGVEQKW